MEKKFEKASRLGYRYKTSKGLITTEDLWNLSLIGKSPSLDSIERSLNKELKDNGEESYVTKNNNTNDRLEARLSIVRHIIDVKIVEKENAENAVAKKAKKEKIMNILSDKEDEALVSKSPGDLRKMLDEL